MRDLGGERLALPVLLLAVMVFHPRFQPLTRVPAPLAQPRAAKAESKVEYINADQLFALFPNHPMALVGKPGRQEVIFLDSPAAGESR